jgi:hypothetical protein
MRFDFALPVKCSAIFKSLPDFLAVAYHVLIPSLDTCFEICVASLANEEPAAYAKHSRKMRYYLMAHATCYLLNDLILLIPFLCTLLRKLSYMLLVY